MRLSNSKLLGICFILGASMVTASSSYADTETLSACVKKSNGATRIISGKMKCTKSERLVKWTSTSDSLIGPAGATGATGAVGPAGANGSNGTHGTNGLDGAVGPAGATGAAGVDGMNGTNGVDGVNGISKALVASGNQATINQGSEGVVLSATIPAGKYAMNLSASINYFNGSTTMDGPAIISCFLTSNSTYTASVNAANKANNFWPTLDNSTPYRLLIEIQPAYDLEIAQRSLSATSTLSLPISTTLNWVCRNYSDILNDPAERVIFRVPKIVLTAVDELVTLN